MGRVYAVVSAKGGVGKTTTAANLAAALAAAGSRVAVVDGDLGMANLASALGVETGEVTLHDVLAGDPEARSGSDDGTESGEVDVAAAIHEGPHGLSVVPGSPALDAFSRADPERLEGVLADLAADHDYVILDTGAGLSNDTVAPLTYVDEILLVSTPTRDALGDTDKTRRVAERLGVTVAGSALLRADPSAADSEEVVGTLDAEILGTVPASEEIRQAADAGEPLTTFAPGSGEAAAFASLAAGLTGEEVAVPAADAADAAVDPDGTPATGSVDAGDADDDDGPAATDDGESDAEPTDEVGGEEDRESEEEAEDETPDEVAVADAADEDTDAEADAADSDPGDDSADSVVEAVDDAPDSPVEPADPEAVATAGDTGDDGDEGVYTTPLEEVPIDEAEAAEGEESNDADTEEAAPTDDAADQSDSDGDASTSGVGDGSVSDDGDDDEDDSGGGGFFSRFFG
jgi:septum site-determining protein MinD